MTQTNIIKHKNTPIVHTENTHRYLREFQTTKSILEWQNKMNTVTPFLRIGTSEANAVLFK